MGYPWPLIVNFRSFETIDRKNYRLQWDSNSDRRSSIVLKCVFAFTDFTCVYKFAMSLLLFF